MKQKTITLPNGFKINSRIWGPEDGVPVIATHGWMDNAATFDRLAPLLPELRIVAIDVPGHGFSDHLPPLSDNAVHKIPPYIGAVADQLGWDKFSIIGHSMGGVAGEFFAAAYPERIEKLALLDIFGFYSLPDESVVEQLRAEYDVYFNPQKPSSFYPSIDLAAKVRKSHGDLSLESARILAEGGLRSSGDGYKWAFDPQIRKRTGLRLNDQQLITMLKHIQAPVCVVVADEGILVRMGHDDARFGHVSNCQVHRVPGGHHVHLDAPQPVADILRQFFELD